jgi:5-carboxyvanillate decarboxylase
VQIFDADTAVALARSTNDQLSEAVKKHPDRFAGLAAIAPQNPAEAAKELERGVRTLGLKGAIVNSHTRGEYLDDPKYWAIFEAAESLNVPIYIHPGTPPPAMIGPFLERGLDGAIYGFAVETGLHLLRIIVSGALYRFPGLRLVAGHLGEGCRIGCSGSTSCIAGWWRRTAMPASRSSTGSPAITSKRTAT